MLTTILTNVNSLCVQMCAEAKPHINIPLSNQLHSSLAGCSCTVQSLPKIHPRTTEQITKIDWTSNPIVSSGETQPELGWNTLKLFNNTDILRECHMYCIYQNSCMHSFIHIHLIKSLTCRKPYNKKKAHWNKI